MSVLAACKTDKKVSISEENTQEQKKYSNPKDEFVQFDTLKAEAVVYKDSIANWKGYHKVVETLEKLKNNTPNEALNISEELVDNVKLMKDSITVTQLKIRGVRARLNALYNQSLRLKEMKNIPAITIPEVKKQTQGLFVIFRMINRKIDAVYKQIDFENELVKENFVFSKLDSIQ